MLKKITAIVLLILSLSILSVSATSVPDVYSSRQPQTGVLSNDPQHATGINNTSLGNEKMSPMATGLLGSVSLDLFLEGGKYPCP